MKQIIKLLLAVFVCSSTVHGQDNYTIDGVISGTVEGKTVYLLYGDFPMGMKTVDSTIIKAGKFHFKGNIKTPGPYQIKIYLTSDRSNLGPNLEFIGRPYIPLFLSNERIHVEATLDSLPLTALHPTLYDYSGVRITGSKENSAYINYLKSISLLSEVKDRLHAAYKQYLDKRPNVSTSEGLAAIGKLDSINSILKSVIKKFILRHRDNLVSLYIFQNELISSNVSTFNPKEIDEIMSSFSSGVKATPYYKKIYDCANQVKKFAVGKKFANLNLIDPKGTSVQLGDYVGKGRYVLLDFWGPWCAPCRKEIPFLKEAYKLYHPEGLEIIAISVDNNKDRWPKAMAKEKMPWKQFAYKQHPFSKNPEKKAFSYWAIPFTVLIGPDGTIIDRNMIGAYADRRLIEIYGNKFASK